MIIFNQHTYFMVNNRKNIQLKLLKKTILNKDVQFFYKEIQMS